MDLIVGLSAQAADTARAMLAPRARPYEGADPAVSRRATAALLALSALLAVAFFPLDHPTDAVGGGGGWALASAVVVASMGVVAWIAVERPGFDELLVVAYAGLAQVAALEWLAGSDSPYRLLFVLWVGAGAVHPPRRALSHLATLVAVMALLGGDTADVVGEALLVVAIGVVLVSYLFHVRRQRAGLEVERRLARKDALTGVGNKRAFDEALTVEVARAEREGRPLSVGLVDVDDLKRINERHGHLEGDRCLQQAARLLEDSLRGEDRCFRWGGDEFAIVLPGAHREHALAVLGRVAERIARDGPRALEVSYGAAEHTPGTSADDLLAMADVSLLERKTERRR
jgi:diguanylate cyclase (GGDEF)-like protein